VDPESVLAIAAATGGVCMSLAPLLQLRRIHERGHADDVSITFLLVIAVGAAIWTAYGVSMPNVALVIPNALGIVTNLATAVTAARHRTPGGADRPGSPISGRARG
jgi:uncharacterized protein with PQ loop repeat